MRCSRPECARKDERGEITDLLVQEKIEHVTLITSNKGAIRGNHYHKESTQWVYVLEGRMRVLSQMPDSPVVATILEKGALLVNVPEERHAMIALEQSTFMVFTRGPRGGEGYERDTYRLPQPLQG